MSEEQFEEIAEKRRMPNNLKKFLIRVQGGKMYLPAAYRIVWFRDEFPLWGVETKLIEGGQYDGYATVQAHILNENGQTISSGMKTETKADFPAGWVEKAETGAIARALAVAGFGTQFSEELDSDQNAQGNWRPADSPVHGVRKPNGTPRRNSDPEPYRHERDDGQRVHHRQEDPATGRPPAPVYRGEEREDPHFQSRLSEEDHATAAELRKGISNHKGWMVNRKLDANNDDLSLFLLNEAMYDIMQGAHTFWTSRKGLKAADWSATQAWLSKLSVQALNSLVQRFTAQQAQGDASDPFASENGTQSEMGADGDGTEYDADAEAEKLTGALLDVPVTATRTGHGDS